MDHEPMGSTGLRGFTRRDSNPCLLSATRFLNPIGWLHGVDSIPQPPDSNSAGILVPFSCRALLAVA
jgi:hypothetical protein